MTPFALSLAAAILYLAVTPWPFRALPVPHAQRAALFALGLHALALGLAIFQGAALHLDFAHAASLFAWQAALLLWAVSLTQPLHILGRVLYPLAAVAALSAGWAGPDAEMPVLGWRAQLHVLLSLLSAGLLTLAAAQALFLALQDRFLHRHREATLVQTLPPLQTMERLLFQVIGLGFFLLSLALLSGLWFIQDWFGQHLVHKTVLSLAAWVIFGVLLWGRARHGWRGRQAIHWTLCGYALLVLAYFGTKLVLEEILGRHWS